MTRVDDALRLRARLRKVKALQVAVNNEIRVIETRLGIRKCRSRYDPPACGTEQGYQWHRYNDADNWPLPAEDPCGCRAAHRAHNRLRYALHARKDAA